MLHNLWSVAGRWSTSVGSLGSLTSYLPPLTAFTQAGDQQYPGIGRCFSQISLFFQVLITVSDELAN